MKPDSYVKKIEKCAKFYEDGDKESSLMSYNSLFRQFAVEISKKKLNEEEIQLVAKAFCNFGKKYKLEAFHYS
jgi:hypothetical protein